MRTYKDLQALRKRGIKNEGQTVRNLWDDSGIKVENKIYRQMEYGDTGYNFTGNSYIIFRNTGKKGKQPTYANRNPFTLRDTFIRIEYKLYDNSLFSLINVERY